MQCNDVVIRVRLGLEFAAREMDGAGVGRKGRRPTVIRVDTEGFVERDVEENSAAAAKDPTKALDVAFGEEEI